jgi:dTMP kinase
LTGRWIAVEGGEGSGKSTQAARLATVLGAVLTREPGGTPVGLWLREVLLDPASAPFDERAEALVIAADRAQHVAAVVAPALAAGRYVVSDRSVWSSMAYQGYGRGLDLAMVRAVSDWASVGRWPDLAVLVEVPIEVAFARIRATGRESDRLEREGADFHRRVSAGFAALAAAEPERWAVVDGVGPEDAVAGRVAEAVRGRLGLA